MNIFKIIITLLKDVTEEFVDSTKEYIYNFLKKIYIFTLLSFFYNSNVLFSIFTDSVNHK